MALIEKELPAAPITEPIALPKELPDLPDDVLKRFPSFGDWQDDQRDWWQKVRTNLFDSLDTLTSGTTDAINKTNNDLTAANGDFSAAITAEQTVRAAADGALASSITSVITAYTAADTTLQSHITTEATTRASADTALSTSVTTVSASLTTETTNRSNADTTLQTNINTVSASVTTEASARATADGFLSGKYTLTVAAGNVVTGMNITSSTGGGTTVSEVSFQADKFQIYSGTNKKVIFVADSVNDLVKLANTLVVTTSGKVYIGTGTFNNTNTSFYVDSAGQFSLKDKFVWDGTTLTINGSGTFSGNLTSTSGSIGGFTLASSSLSAGSGGTAVSLQAGGFLTMGSNTGSEYYLQISSGYNGSGGSFVSRYNTKKVLVLDTHPSSPGRGEISLYDSAETLNVFISGLGFISAINGNFSGDTTIGGNLKVNAGGDLPGFGNTATGFEVEAGTGAIFASRSDSNFVANFNHNANGTLISCCRSGTSVGSISVTTTNTAFNTSSDARIKTNVIDASDVGSVIDSIRVREFEFLSDPGKRVLGFIAQELYQVFPAAVTPGDSGEEVVERWQMDRSALSPLIVRELQSLRARLLAAGI